MHALHRRRSTNDDDEDEEDHRTHMRYKRDKERRVPLHRIPLLSLVYHGNFSSYVELLIRKRQKSANVSPRD